jgi:hypothetical protein
MWVRGGILLVVAFGLVGLAGCSGGGCGCCRGVAPDLPLPARIDRAVAMDEAGPVAARP